MADTSESKAQRLTDGMTLEQQIGQVFMVGFHGDAPSSDVLELIEQRQVGGVILFSRNVRDAAQTQALTNSLQAHARAAGHRSPLLIAADQENGLVQRFGAAITRFPGAMALGATGSAQLTREVAEATGQELRALGVNMNLAPIADVNNNPANPVIGVRSFGEDPELVARLVAASVEGYRAAGVIATLKHFPGHGDTATDSHLALPIVPHTLERLTQLELLPFKRGIAAGADAIMTAHLALPQFISRDSAMPATLSTEVLQGLLREQLGFTGVVVSDCLEMEAIAGGVGVAAGAVAALRAGVDLVLISHRAERQRTAISAALAAVEQGDLAATAIQHAAERVLRLKARYLSWDDASSLTSLALPGGVEHQRLRDRAYARSTTLIRDEAGLLPLRLEPTARIVVIGLQGARLSPAVDLAYSNEDMVASIRRYHPNVSGVSLAPDAVDGARQQLTEAVAAADLIILPTLNVSHDPNRLAVLHALLSLASASAVGQNIIGIAIGAPYDATVLSTIPTYLATYEYTPPALDAAVDVLFGTTQPQGHLPVTLASRGAVI